MCDTLIALPEATAAGFAILAKNSDRPPNEAQYLEWIPERSYDPGTKLRCTYLEIPQVEHTWGVLLSRPFWMWGGEMGVNQHGLAIGNEAVFSKIPANKEPALLGMDLLRLGLERAVTASQAVEVITSLLEEFGQGGNCVQEGQLYYHNSFLIEDPWESWVLETIDRQWAAKKVEPLYSISNLLSLEDSWDRSSPGLEEYILEHGLAKSRQEINITGDLSDLIYTTFADGRKRCTRSHALMQKNQGDITIATLMEILRDHGQKMDPMPGLSGANICMHASLGPIRGSQSTASLIASLADGSPLIFGTGASAPCTGIFKPIWVDAPIDLGPKPSGRFDPSTQFWFHEQLHREVIRNFPQRIEAFREQRDALEQEFIQGALDLRDADRTQRQSYSQDCFEQAYQAETGWLRQVRSLPVKGSFLSDWAWKAFNKAAGFH